MRLKAVRFEPVEAGTDLPGMRRSSEFVTILLTILLMLGLSLLRTNWATVRVWLTPPVERRVPGD